MQSNSDKEFLELLMRTITVYLHQKYDKRELPDVISSCMKFYSEYKTAVNDKKKPLDEKQHHNYKPEGKREKEFHFKVQKLLAKNK